MMLINTRRQKKDGLTLVELVVSVAIMAIIGLAGMNFVTEFSAKADLNKAAAEIISSIKYARSMAVTLQRPSGMVGNLTTVRMDNLDTGTTKSIVVMGVNSNGQWSYGRPFVYDPKDNLTLTFNPAGQTIRFTAMEGKMSFDDPGNPVGAAQTMTITLTSPETSLTKTITINSSGGIEE